MRGARSAFGVIVLALCLPLVAQAQGARGEDVGLAKKYFDLGRELYDRSDYRGALAQFEHAYALSKRAALLFNIARCYESLGEHAKAITYYERFLPDSDDKEAEVRARIANLRRLVAERHAEEQRVLALGAPQPRPGPPQVAARAEPGRPLRTAGWILLGAGGAGLIAGIALAALSKKRQDDVEAAARAGKEWVDWEDTAAQGRAFRTGGFIGVGVGAAIAVTGAVLLILDSRRSTTETATRAWISPQLGPGGGGVAAGLSF